jgi:hypothetical protein
VGVSVATSAATTAAACGGLCCGCGPRGLLSLCPCP